MPASMSSLSGFEVKNDFQARESFGSDPHAHEGFSVAHKARFRMDEFYSQFHLPTGIADSPKRYIHRAPVLNVDSLLPTT